MNPDELAALEEQRDFLLRSIEDLDREFAAGDLDEDDHRALRDDYTARAADTIRSIDDGHQALAAARRPRSLGRTLLTVSVVLVLALAAGAALASALGSRQAGDSATGGIRAEQTPSQKAQLCIRTLNTDPAGTIDCFKAVLDQDPRNVVALTWLAWSLELTSSSLPVQQAVELQASAEKLIDRAIEVDPEYSYARAFRAVIAYRNGHYADAKQYLADFRAGNPSTDAEGVIEQMDLEANITKALQGQASTTTTTTTP